MGSHGASPTLPTPHSSRVPTVTLHASAPRMTRRSRDTGRSSPSNPVDEAHVPATGRGTPQANGSSVTSGRFCHLRPLLPPPRRFCPLLGRVPVRFPACSPGGLRVETASMLHRCVDDSDVPSMLFPGRVPPGRPAAGRVPTGRRTAEQGRSGWPDGAGRHRKSKTHRWPLDGQSAPPGQRRDLASPAAAAGTPANRGLTAESPLLWLSLATRATNP